MRVFLSYSRKDATFVGKLADDLRARGVEAWLDTDDLSTADDDRWRRSVVKGIRESTALVVVLTPNSVASGQVERELTIAAEANRRIIPIVQRPCVLSAGLEYELAGTQRISFAEQDYDRALDQLIRRIGAPSMVDAEPRPVVTTAAPVDALKTILRSIAVLAALAVVRRSFSSSGLPDTKTGPSAQQLRSLLRPRPANSRPRPANSRPRPANSRPRPANSGRARSSKR